MMCASIGDVAFFTVLLLALIVGMGAIIINRVLHVEKLIKEKP